MNDTEFNQKLNQYLEIDKPTSSIQRLEDKIQELEQRLDIHISRIKDLEHENEKLYDLILQIQEENPI